MNRLQPQHQNNIVNITWATLALIGGCWLYLQPVRIQSAKLIAINLAQSMGGEKYLAEISEPNSRSEQFEVSDSTAKSLKNLQDKSKDCYINLVVANGLVPFATPRFIVSIDEQCHEF